MRALRAYGPTIEAAGGIDAIDPGRLAEMVAMEIMLDQESARERAEMIAASSIGF